MSKKFYLSYFSYAAVIYSLILLFSAWPEFSVDRLNVQLLSFFTVSSVLFPFAVALTERINQRATRAAHWNRWVGFICLIFAIPLGVIFLLAQVIKKR